MSTSSGSRVRREGTIAMSSNPYARRAFLPRPISTSIAAILELAAAGRAGRSAVGGRSEQQRRVDGRQPSRASIVAADPSGSPRTRSAARGGACSADLGADLRAARPRPRRAGARPARARRSRRRSAASTRRRRRRRSAGSRPGRARHSARRRSRRGTRRPSRRSSAASCSSTRTRYSAGHPGLEHAARSSRPDTVMIASRAPSRVISTTAWARSSASLNSWPTSSSASSSFGETTSGSARTARRSGSPSVSIIVVTPELAHLADERGVDVGLDPARQAARRTRRCSRPWPGTAASRGTARAPAAETAGPRSLISVCSPVVGSSTAVLVRDSSRMRTKSLRIDSSLSASTIRVPVAPPAKPGRDHRLAEAS